MAGALDSSLRKAAKDLISRLGSSATYVSRSSTFSASTGKTTNTDTSRSVTISPPNPVTKERISGGLAEVGDFECMVAAKDLAFAPAIGDRLTFGGETWQVTRYLPVYSGEEVAAYELMLRL